MYGLQRPFRNMKILLKWLVAECAQPQDCFSGTPQIKNHTTSLYKRNLYLFGGYDGKKNHNHLKALNIDTYTWSIVKTSDQ